MFNRKGRQQWNHHGVMHDGHGANDIPCQTLHAVRPHDQLAHWSVARHLCPALEDHGASEPPLLVDSLLRFGSKPLLCLLLCPDSSQGERRMIRRHGRCHTRGIVFRMFALRLPMAGAFRLKGTAEPFDLLRRCKPCASGRSWYTTCRCQRRPSSNIALCLHGFLCQLELRGGVGFRCQVQVRQFIQRDARTDALLPLSVSPVGGQEFMKAFQVEVDLAHLIGQVAKVILCLLQPLAGDVTAAGGHADIRAVF
mmetsp:Transcript_11158/g.26332  ORF Transcript_11158/g.26332 Transcript_11158/m.26332 type:complete len:253 (+) Transcript_11158:348-1106(+)